MTWFGWTLVIIQAFIIVANVYSVGNKYSKAGPAALSTLFCLLIIIGILTVGTGYGLG